MKNTAPSPAIIVPVEVLDATRPSTLDGEAMALRLREVLVTEIARQRMEITADLRRELAANTVGDGVSLGNHTARVEVLLPIRALARRLATVDPSFTRASHCTRIHLNLRDALGLSMHPAWALVPVQRLGEIRAALATKESEVRKREAQLKSTAREPRQGELPLK